MRISVIIPCYNSGEHLARCIDSVLKQDPLPWEIICVNDGSTDDTGVILDNYRRSYSTLVKIIDQQNAGASAARNRGLRAAEGDYVQFLDADDALLPGKLSHQLSLAVAYNNPGIIAGSFTRFFSDRVEKVPVYEGDIWIALIRGRLGSTCSNLFNRNSLNKIGGWTENLKSSQETDLMFRLLCAREEVFRDEKFLTEVYFREVGSISSKHPTDNLKRFIELRFRMGQWLQEQNVLTEERRKEIGAITLGTLRNYTTWILR
jgi:glycosyltransferase involved in cell wall biosynthesis